MDGVILSHIGPFVRGLPHINVAAFAVNFHIAYTDPIRHDPAEVNAEALADFFIQTYVLRHAVENFGFGVNAQFRLEIFIGIDVKRTDVFALVNQHAFWLLMRESGGEYFPAIHGTSFYRMIG